MKKIFASALAVLWFSIAETQTQNIRGQVFLSESSERIVGAYINLSPSDKFIFSNANGEFSFDNIPYGQYTITCHMLGYNKLSLPIVIDEKEMTHIIIQLHESHTQLPELTVMTQGTNSLKNVPGSVHVITARELQKFKYTDVHRTLRNIPGVHIQEEDGFGLRPNIGMRGTGVERSSKINIMEDGVLAAPAPYAEPAAYYFPTIGRMQGVEILKGSSQIKYGPHTTGGAINLISQSIPESFEGKVQLVGGSYGFRNVHAMIGNTHGRFGYIVENINIGSTGFKKLDQNNNTGFNKNDVLVKLDFDINTKERNKQRISFKWGKSDESSNETYLGLSEEDFGATPFQRYAASQEDNMATSHQQMVLTYLFRPTKNIHIELQAYRNDFKRNWYKLDKLEDSAGVKLAIADILDNTTKYNMPYQILSSRIQNTGYGFINKANNRKYYSQGIQLLGNYNIKTKYGLHQLTMGSRLHQDEADRFQWEDEYILESGQMKLRKTGLPGSESNRIQAANAWSGFIQYNMQIEKWKMYPGLRYENIRMLQDDFGKNDPSRTGTQLKSSENKIGVWIPGVGVDYSWNKHWNSFIGIHKGFGPPSSNPQTQAEESINYELGLRATTTKYQSSVILFYNDYSNLLGADLAASGGTGSGDLFNGGEVISYGLEYEFKTDLLQYWSNLHWRMPFNASYTFTDARFQTSFKSSFEDWGQVASGDHLPYLASHQFSIGIGLEGKTYQFNVNGRFMDHMLTHPGKKNNQDIFKTDQYFILDISVSKHVHKYVELFTSMTNLTNAVYVVASRPAGLRPGMPRAINVGIKASF